MKFILKDMPNLNSCIIFIEIYFYVCRKQHLRKLCHIMNLSFDEWENPWHIAVCAPTHCTLYSVSLPFTS